jgi:hypothetical protein
MKLEEWLVKHGGDHAEVIWTVINSQFAATIITGIVGVFAYKAAANTKRTADNSDETAAAQESIKFEKQAEIAANETTKQDLAENQSQTGGGKAASAGVEVIVDSFRVEAKDLVVKSRKYLENRVGTETDGRYKRTYKYIGKNYPALAAALHERGRINTEQFNAFISIFKIWNSYERGYVANRPVPKSIFEHMKIFYKIATLT